MRKQDIKENINLEYLFNQVVERGTHIVERNFKVPRDEAWNYVESLRCFVKLLFSDFPSRVNSLHRNDSIRSKRLYYELGVRGRIPFSPDEEFKFKFFLDFDNSIKFEGTYILSLSHQLPKTDYYVATIRTYEDALKVLKLVKDLKIKSSLLK